MLWVKNRAEETCLPLNQGWRCRELMPIVVFFTPWMWECAKSRSCVCFAFQNSRKRRKVRTLEAQLGWGTMVPQLDPALALPYLVPHPTKRWGQAVAIPQAALCHLNACPCWLLTIIHVVSDPTQHILREWQWKVKCKWERNRKLVWAFKWFSTSYSFYTLISGFLLGQSYSASKVVFKCFTGQKLQPHQFSVLNWFRHCQNLQRWKSRGRCANPHSVCVCHN